MTKTRPYKVYLAARVSRRPDLQRWIANLEECDIEIVSRWALKGSDHTAPSEGSPLAPPLDRERYALEDLEDIHACDAVISLMEEPRTATRGGRHVEFGYAMALDKQLWIVGPKETVFHELPNVRHYSSWGECLAELIVAVARWEALR